VQPEVPAGITAQLRPYQLEGFHFLAYLSTNHFGGVLADDMGLGKTLQALTWLAWLRETQEGRDHGEAFAPMLVVCPKSVQDNWRSETARFYPGLRVTVWSRDVAGKSGLEDGTDLLVIHYQQLRQHEEALSRQHWLAVILDEAQAIKNPASQSARAACTLLARHRLALSGTPVENRLLDLWSILGFAMPGILGNRAHFAKHFDAKEDPLARRRLAARVRPFLLRRTKKEVAKDLPDRIEEDLVCELEGGQRTLYQAELKRARAALLKVETSKQLDKARFNILTSLLRLRQICCHPALVLKEGSNPDDSKPVVSKRRTKQSTEGAGESGSAKLDALLELLEPIMEEGGKVLVFSQFVEMLNLVRAQLEARQWQHFLLTGQTEDRGTLVQQFQECAGPAVFLISLKAGGSGLNLTAASYIVLCDPWWNPAVEAQAIDRTHRIGQTQKVNAYRLIVKDSIEEKIRLLQKQKSALAHDILGEENFASALTLQDFQFLLGEG
jgi:SNF2 family DNA or RNA helicase